jgi:hypothetical protein
MSPPSSSPLPLDVRYDDVLSVLGYLYRGEVSVARANLESFLTLAGNLGVTGFSPASTSPWVLPLTKPPYLMNIVVPVPAQYQASPPTSVPRVLRYEYGWPAVTYSAVDDEDQYNAVPTVSPGCATSPLLHGTTGEDPSPRDSGLCEQPRDPVLPHEARPCDARRGILDADSYDHLMTLENIIRITNYEQVLKNINYNYLKHILNYFQNQTFMLETINYGI